MLDQVITESARDRDRPPPRPRLGVDSAGTGIPGPADPDEAGGEIDVTPFDEIDETRGHNIFLKVYSEGWILDLISYV